MEDGKQLQILRDNMPFGRPGHGEFGTYFIGYCRTPRVTVTMLVGRPPGNYDRLLDFSRAVTGSLFFVPSATFLDHLGTAATDVATSASNSMPAAPVREASLGTGSLNIGSLKGEKNE
jgi:putative iron-dependent peroxidase